MQEEVGLVSVAAEFERQVEIGSLPEPVKPVSDIILEAAGSELSILPDVIAQKTGLDITTIEDTLRNMEVDGKVTPQQEDGSRYVWDILKNDAVSLISDKKTIKSEELADLMSISVDLASSVLEQLEESGNVGSPDESGERRVTKPINLEFHAGRNRFFAEMFVRSEFRVGSLDSTVEDADGSLLQRIELVKLAGANFAEVFYTDKETGTTEKVADLEILTWPNEESVKAGKPIHGLPNQKGLNYMATQSFKRVFESEHALHKPEYLAIKDYVHKMITNSATWRREHEKDEYSFLDLPTTSYFTNGYSALRWKQMEINADSDGYIIGKDRGETSATVYKGGKEIGTISLTPTKSHRYKSKWSSDIPQYGTIEMQEYAARFVESQLEPKKD